MVVEGAARRSDMSKPARGGFSLLEVVVAMAIFLMAMVVIGELVNMGARNSLMARQMTKAVLLAESKQNETLTGNEIGQSEISGNFPEEPDWQYTVNAEPAGIDGLLRVTTTVSFAGTSSDEQVSVTLTRWATDPAWRQTLVSSQSTGQSAGQDSGASNAP